MLFLHSLRQTEEPKYQNAFKKKYVGVTIGNFDGIHVGHQAVFSALSQLIKKHCPGKEATQTLLTFCPHPRGAIARIHGEAVDPIPSITSYRQKIELAETFGFDAFILLRFGRALSELSPRRFVNEVLLQKLKINAVVVGYDWRFGKGRMGDVELLSAMGRRSGFQVEIVPPFSLEEERVSSSVVKKAIADGDLVKLEQLLGRKFSIQGRVVAGSKRGRTLGFPTANLKIGNQVYPPIGVYAAWAHFKGRRFAAAVNLGIRPVFEEAGEVLLEVHLIGVEGIELYGERVAVDFVSKLRDESCFDTVDQLVEQMRMDVQLAQTLLQTNET